MLLEIALHQAHFLGNGLLGIALHAHVDGCVNFQAVGVQIHIVGAAPVAQFIGHGGAEIKRFAVVGALHAVVQLHRQLLQRIGLAGRQVATTHHVVKHHIAPPQTVFGVQARIVALSKPTSTAHSSIFRRDGVVAK